MGKTTIVNFFDAQQNALDVEFVGAGLTDATQGDHVLDFTNWLNDGLSATGSLDSYIRTATTEDLIVAGGDLNLDSNEVVVVNDWAAAAGETFALMTASDIDASLEGTTLYGSLVGSTAVAAAGTEYSGDTISSILMIENDLNEGEYNVYNVESDSTAAAGSQFAVTLVGTVDFGESYTLDSAEAANANFA